MSDDGSFQLIAEPAKPTNEDLSTVELDAAASHDHYGGHHQEPDQYHGGHHSQQEYHQPHTQSQSYSHSAKHSSSEDHDHYRWVGWMGELAPIIDYKYHFTLDLIYHGSLVP